MISGKVSGFGLANCQWLIANCFFSQHKRRMMLPQHANQMFFCDVRIPLGRSDGRVSQEFLHNAKYPQIAQDFAHSFQVLRELPCDVFLTAHAAQFGLLHKWHPGLPYSPETFVDPESYQRAIEHTEASFFRHVQEERDEEQANRDRLHFKDVLPQ